MAGTVLVLGANGNFGAACAAAFGAVGWTVRRYRRGSEMNAAAIGADVIVNGLNPPNYHAWGRLIPEITAGAIAAAKASGATLIVPGNVYNFGIAPGPWSEDTPQNPVSRKGRIRTEMEQTYRWAARDGVQVIILRGGDFIDAGRSSTIMGRVTLSGLRRGRITAMGAPDVTRAYAYLPDLARAAVALAGERNHLAALEDVPFPGHAFSTNDLADAINRLTGRQPKVVRFGWWQLTLASPFWELARELREMRYLYDIPHRLDGAKFARLVPGFRPTPFDTVIAAHLPPSGQVDVNPDKAMA